MKGMNATWDERAERARAYAQATDAPGPRPYGCHNRAPFPATTVMQDGWTEARDGHGNPVRTPVWRDVPMRMRRDCRYTHTGLGQQDPRCTGCTHRTTTPEGD